MTTYTISFYPGMVLPRPYYVTVDAPTNDYQALLDMLVDEQLQDAPGLFDFDGELPDDEVTVAGNESKRLITGGMLNIRMIECSDVKAIICEKAGTDLPSGSVNIQFINNADREDETQFNCVDADDLTSLWRHFCSENNLSLVSITGVEVLGWKEVEVLMSVVEYGQVNVSVFQDAEDDEIIEAAEREVQAGNGMYFDSSRTYGGFNNLKAPKPDITNFSTDDLISGLSDFQKDEVYRHVLYGHIKEDVKNRLDDVWTSKYPVDKKQEITEEVAEQIVYNGKIDANLSHWDNIDSQIQNLIRIYKK